MILLDSNIVIYSTQALPEFDLLREFLLTNPHCVSVITWVEVLGFHEINEIDKASFQDFFAATPVLSVTSEIAARAIQLKQNRRMTLGDALIAATALENNLLLVTRNTKDFEWINSLKLINPLDSK